ncbi:hypothetical protein FNF29_02835 [Cafeteria roenbergensis]|uniref:Dehydrogenase/reductase SDR family member 12 n=1 Tax=Cafeteria roenbergensis TaxID=33653 RepID=A0A5A8CL86_CAFRO|nr:hypothetical protein FNF29_02835 [Cafeteria roenbergensis]|eukprot:KAA0153846.1 hypothetical protein FNF29_02835 [Cafeteria roenbergensis]
MGGYQSTLGPVVWLAYGRQAFGKHGFDAACRRFIPGDVESELAGKHYIVTGANSGLGFEASKALLSRGASVAMVCRSEERGKAALAKLAEATGKPESFLSLHIVDMEDKDSVRSFAVSWLKSGRQVQALINNAGRIPGEERELAKDGSTESAFAIMANGTFLLTGLLRPAYVKGSRVVNVSSGGMYTCGLRADNFQLQKHYTPLLAYAHSKRAQVILSEQWAERLRKDGVVVSSMHPGWALTEGVRDQLDGFKAGGKLRSPAEGADTIVWLAAGTSSGDLEAVAGKFFLDREPAATHLSMAFTKEDEAARDALWEECIRVCEFDPDAAPGGSPKAGAAAAAGASSATSSDARA